jgi:hypothetical protein
MFRPPQGSCISRWFSMPAAGALSAGAMSTRLLIRLVLDALDMALAMRRPDGVIHHSDQGSQ